MNASKKNTSPSSPVKPASDMARVDAHVIQPHEYHELPDLSDFDPADGVSEVAGTPARGRPALGDKAKRAVSLRLDADTIDAFKSAGPGWQTRMNGWLAKRQEIVDLLLTYEESVTEMRVVLAYLEDPESGVRAVKPDQVKSIKKVERQIALTESAALGLRNVLNEQTMLVAAAL